MREIAKKKKKVFREENSEEIRNMLRREQMN